MPRQPHIPAMPNINTPDTHIGDRVSDEHLWDQVLRRQPGDFLLRRHHHGRVLPARLPVAPPAAQERPLLPQPGEAEAAGFRACKRCDPKGERAGIAQAVVRDACAFIEASDDIPSLDALATRSGYSRFHFLRMFRDHTGLTPRSYAEGVRARRLQAALADRRARGRRGGRRRLRLGIPRLREDRRAARHDAGRGAPRRGRGGHPHRLRRLPVRPAAGRRHRQGRLLHRLCRAGRGAARRSAPAASRAPHRGRRRRAGRHGARRCWTSWRNRSRRWTCRSTCAAPRSSSGYGARCARIPPGETRTYGEVAAAIGDPRAVRAVARSCATNPVSLAVPCHRVIGSDGALTGYRWGVPRKRALLEKERAAAGKAAA